MAETSHQVSQINTGLFNNYVDQGFMLKGFFVVFVRFFIFLTVERGEGELPCRCYFV